MHLGFDCVVENLDLDFVSLLFPDSSSGTTSGPLMVVVAIQMGLAHEADKAKAFLVNFCPHSLLILKR